MLYKFLVAALSANVLVAACCDPVTEYELPGGRYENNFYVQGDFLYWYAKQQGNEFAASGVASTVPGTTDPNTGLIPGPITASGHVYEPKFRMEPGFRAGAGINLEHGKWDLFLEYTYFDSKAKGSVSTLDLNTGILPIFGLASNNSILTEASSFGGNNGFISTARGSWGLHFNNITFELGRSLQFCPLFGLRPHFGLQGSWQKQFFHTNYGVNSLTDTAAVLGENRVLFRQRYWGVGLRAGLDSYWSVWRYFGLFANSAVSALWSQFNNQVRSFDTNTIAGYNNVLIGYQKHSPHTLIPVVQLEIGAQFDWVFRNCKSMMFQAGWEGQIWFSQNQHGSSNGDASLILQGFTFKGKFGY